MCTRAVYATAEGPSPREGPVAFSVDSDRIISYSISLSGPGTAVLRRPWCGARTQELVPGRRQRRDRRNARDPLLGRAGDVSRRYRPNPAEKES